MCKQYKSNRLYVCQSFCFAGLQLVYAEHRRLSNAWCFCQILLSCVPLCVKCKCQTSHAKQKNIHTSSFGKASNVFCLQNVNVSLCLSIVFAIFVFNLVFVDLKSLAAYFVYHLLEHSFVRLVISLHHCTCVLCQ